MIGNKYFEGENTQKSITYSILIIKINKNDNKSLNKWEHEPRFGGRGGRVDKF